MTGYSKWNTASMKSLEDPGTGWFRTGLFALSDNDDLDADEEVMRPMIHFVEREFLLYFIAHLTLGPKDIQNDSFITPSLAKKPIDFVHLLQHGASVRDDKAEALVRNWYRVQSSETVTVPYTDRTKTSVKPYNC
ncbi:unnamed protein product [Adineta ricciae]|uniref:Uncharacterized protein n=1 Tax=Adineta ricciae TaxID=249248 RepID=A0A814Z671_ADIRI|nr:unnamed protein product [Adineta ricciae]CAF1447244.1 unnamed protein product [Adineta ricciae]